MLPSPSLLNYFQPCHIYGPVSLLLPGAVMLMRFLRSWLPEGCDVIAQLVVGAAFGCGEKTYLSLVELLRAIVA